MKNTIIVPFGVRTRLADEFGLSRPTVNKMLKGANTSNKVITKSVRDKAIKLGGAYIQ
mgnify:CR=1 FL=1